jgi:hypothetical protein
LGRSEEIVGRAIADRSLRSHVVMIVDCHNHRDREIIEVLDSAKRQIANRHTQSDGLQ